MTTVRPARVTVYGPQLSNCNQFRGSAPILYDQAGKMVAGVVVDVVVDGKISGTIKTPLGPWPAKMHQHTLTPDSSFQEHVRRSDLSAAGKIIKENRECMGTFLPSLTPARALCEGFGIHPTNAMYFTQVTDYKDWGHVITEECIYPYRPFMVHPSAQALHYGEAGWEGMKAKTDINGNIVGFGWDLNAVRYNNTMNSGGTIPMPIPLFIQLNTELVLVNREFVPPFGAKGAFYIRPWGGGLDPILGVSLSKAKTHLGFGSDVGLYNTNAQKLLIQDDINRTGPKMGGNNKQTRHYSGVLKAEKEAKEAGYSGILFCNSIRPEIIEELGSGNVFFLIGDELATPSLEDGTILPGNTRKRVIELARALGIKAVERKVAIAEAMKAKEVFSTGNATVINPVESITYRGNTANYRSGDNGSLTLKLLNALTAIQDGDYESDHLKRLSPEMLAEIKTWNHIIATPEDIKRRDDELTVIIN